MDLKGQGQTETETYMLTHMNAENRIDAQPILERPNWCFHYNFSPNQSIMKVRAVARKQLTTVICTDIHKNTCLTENINLLF